MSVWRVTVLAFGVGSFLFHVKAADEFSARRDALQRAIREAGAVAEVRIAAAQIVQEVAA